MIRFCPNCKTERPLSEIFCQETLSDASTCNWDLSALPIRERGHGQEAASPPSVEVSALRHCPNGHEVSEGDLICAVCGAEIAEVRTEGQGEPIQANTAPGPVTEHVPTQIAGWTVERRIPSPSVVCERFIVRQEHAGRTGILSLFANGSEPDVSVYDAIRGLSHDHLPEVFEVGRWEDRAFEISEEIKGGTLEDAKPDGRNLETIRSVIFEIGKALHSFSQAGLRHRDLRPANIMVRNEEPLDLVVTGFGSARLSDFDLDVVAPLEITRYMAPETIAGGVAAASDWWSLGIITLEIATSGACFDGINEQAFLIHVLTNGVEIPETIDPSVGHLLRGLLSRDHRARWQWQEVRAWLNGEHVDLPPEATRTPDADGGAGIDLRGKSYRKASAYALAAAQPTNWDEARVQAARGVIAAWAEDANLGGSVQSAIRRLAHIEALSEDLRLSLALKVLHPEMPLVVKGNIVTPGWLLDHPEEGTDLIFGPAIEFLERLGAEEWLRRLRHRGESVRSKARQFGIALNEEELQIQLLSTSRARLAALWEDRRKILPDTDHSGLVSLIERRQTTEEDLILLLSAEVGQFRSVDEIIEKAQEEAGRAGVQVLNEDEARQLLSKSRRDLHRMVDERLEGFAHCGVERVDEWADRFRLDRRMAIERVLVLLSVPTSSWKEPPKQAYVSTLLDYFSKKVSGSILRGPLTRMVIGKTTPRADLVELGTARRTASALLDHLLARTDRTEELDPAAFTLSDTLERRLRVLHAHSTLYKRDTGIDGLYLGFPFLLYRDDRTKTKIAPVLLWPVKVIPEVGNRGHASVAFDRDRDEVRLNPAFEGIMGMEAARRWQDAAKDLLGRATLTAADVIDGFGGLADITGRTLDRLPGKDAEAEFGQPVISCSAVLFHLAYMGQAIAEDLRQLKSKELTGSALETSLKVVAREPKSPAGGKIPEIDKYFTVDSDPSQEAAVLEARNAPGLLIEGPPGTGKSQTIVNMVADAIGRKKSLLVICQKQAALEVVKKRLVAEGMDDRIFMITDMNRDREPMLKAIRDQLEARRDTNTSQAWRRERQTLAQRIEAIEGELDQHHASLHAEDTGTGLTYRTVLGELIGIESGRAPLNVPALRRQIGEIPPADLSALEEKCASHARYWLPADFEGSPLEVLKIFNPDAANVEAFRDDLIAFVRNESERLSVLNRTPNASAISEPGPYRDWHTMHDSDFRNLADYQRSEFVRWHRLFTRAADGSSEASQMGEYFKGVAERLASIQGAPPSDRYVKEFVKLSDTDLSRSIELAEAVTSPPSALGWLNPFRWTRARKLRAYLAELGLDSNEPHPFLAAGLWERNLRPLRRELSSVLGKIGEQGLVEPERDVAYLAKVSEQRGRALLNAQALADAVWSYPEPSWMESAVLAGTLSAYETLRENIHRAFERHEARQFSRAAASNLEQWFQGKWIEDRLVAINTDQTNAGALERIVKTLEKLEPYQRFRLRLNALSPEALEVLRLLRPKAQELAALPIDQLDDEVRKIIRREALLTWKSRLETQNPALLLERRELENKVRALADAERLMRQANRQLLVGGIDFSKVASEREWEPITRLRGQRAQRLREFMEKGPDLGLMELRPVWLMNPDVASRVLPLRKGMFDIVIYDEASQMPVEYALPTLFRGQVVIVSGDEKQMPPTAFFASKVENDEADVFAGEELDEDASEVERENHEETWNRREIKDCPDLLQLAKAVLPTTTLQIHYRSEYRELIGFSNASFYANRLNVPMRHPDEEIQRARPIEVVRVDGVYKDQTNPAEAHKVVEILADIWRKDGRLPTIGVVTFNRKQADLIEEMLEERAEDDDWFSAILARERDRVERGEDVGFFVKNVENVQGDERDYIIFSSTFGRNAQGTFRKNFGVLGQKGGERRLNVAVTRAKSKVIMITSIPVPDVSDMLSSRRRPSIPRDYLQGYLEYARVVSSGEFEAGRTLLGRMVSERFSAQSRNEDDLDGFAQDVFQYLSSLGVTARAVNDGSAFGMDFAVEDPRTGSYGIGVECDAPRHRILASARAREIWRPSVLQRAIPRVHRVSSHGWYHSGDEERLRLKAAIQHALQKELA
jgi:primosomal replication protein N''